MNVYLHILVILTSLLAGLAYAKSQQEWERRMQVQVALNAPSFSDKLQFYETLYKRPSFYPSLSLKGVTAHKLFALGWGVEFGYSYDTGFAAVAQDGEADNSTTNITAGVEPIYLTLIPLQLTLLASAFPVGEWLRLDFAIGHEFLYVQEERDLRSKREYKLLHTSWELHGVLSSGMSVSLRFLGLDRDNDILMHTRYEWMFPYGAFSNEVFQRSELAVGFTFETS